MLFSFSILSLWEAGSTRDILICSPWCHFRHTAKQTCFLPLGKTAGIVYPLRIEEPREFLIERLVCTMTAPFLGNLGMIWSVSSPAPCHHLPFPLHHLTDRAGAMLGSQPLSFEGEISTRCFCGICSLWRSLAFPEMLVTSWDTGLNYYSDLLTAHYSRGTGSLSYEEPRVRSNWVTPV